MAEFRMPALGADMEAGTLVEWLVKPGDAVKRGDIVAVVETQKGTIDIETFQSGVVDQLLVEPGTESPVGTPLALIRGEGEAPLPPRAAATAAMPAPAPAAAAPAPQPAAPPSAHWTQGERGRVRVSPAARKRAEQLGVDLATVEGTGPGGAIQIIDVERAAEHVPAVVEVAADPLAAMRRAIAASMARSKREIPHYYLASEIDLTRALAWLEAENLKRPLPERLLPAALLLKAVALAVADVPEVNGYWVHDAFQPSEAVHLGVAVSLRGGGLVAPAIHDVANLPMGDLMAALRDLVMRARGGKLRSSEISDPTITVTNLGEQGVSTVFPVIYPPQVAIVGFGAILQRPWVVDGNVAARPIVTATLAGDHRASVGHRGARFLAAVDRLLQKPEAL